jgi:hypothetical protein
MIIQSHSCQVLLCFVTELKNSGNIWIWLFAAVVRPSMIEELISSLQNDQRYEKIKLVQPEKCDNSIYFAIIQNNVSSNTTNVNKVFWNCIKLLQNKIFNQNSLPGNWITYPKRSSQAKSKFVQGILKDTSKNIQPVLLYITLEYLHCTYCLHQWL